MNYYLPIGILVASNLVYHITAKSAPQNMDPFASLTITYLAGAVFAGIFYFVSHKNGNLLKEYRQINWATLVMGLTVVFMEFGTISLYKVGWNVNTGQLVYSSILSVCLILLGYFLYHETLTLSKFFGILLCMAGLVLINR